MPRATPQMRKLAKRLLAYETLRRKSAEAKNPVAFYVLDRLRPVLGTLMGKGGFRALLLRALALANAEVGWLRDVEVTGDGDLAGLAELQAKLGAAEFLKARIILVAELLGLLVAFIGPSLTSRLLLEIWPKLSLTDIEFGVEVKHAKTT